jgi:hypothetical protein
LLVAGIGIGALQLSIDARSVRSEQETPVTWLVGRIFPAVVSCGCPDGSDLGNWWWRYTLGFGSDKACPNDAYQWADSAGNGSGAQNGDGNILTPNATDCT